MVRVLAVVSVALPLAALAAPAAAQVSDEIVVNILRNCAQIDDPTARLACYDNNIRAAGANPRNSVPGQMAVPGGGAGVAMDNGRASGFGSDDLPNPDRFSPPAGQPEAIAARITGVALRQQGIYLVTLEDGAQWLFAEDVPLSYRPPRVGGTAEIERGALGSFRLTYDDQPSVRVSRVR